MQPPTQRLLTWIRRSLVRCGVALLAAGCAATAPQGQPVNEQYADPPARVGRISYVAGNVTLTDTLHGDRDAATLNWPITSAQRLTSGPDGVAEVRIGSLAVYLDVNSSVEFTRIDDDAVRILVRQGSIALRPRGAELLAQLQVVTPREEIVIDDVGRYRIDVDRIPGITGVATESGQARVVAGGSSFVIAAGQRGESLGTYDDVRLVSMQADGFDNWVRERDRRDEQVYAERYVAPETTGIESLDEYGSWRTVESYGTVWVPRSIPTGWAPYRYGRWAWIAPWGWTWIDDAPWGFTPFHYGRWVVASGTWCWVPGAYVRRPVYAPALVAWYGTPGVSISVTSGAPIGWFPLGPGEVYVPGYHVSRRYVNAINVQHVRNINQISTVNAPPRYLNQIHPDAVTYAPPRALPGRMRIQDVATRAPTRGSHARVGSTASAAGDRRAVVQAQARSRRQRGGGRAWGRRRAACAAASPADATGAERIRAPSRRQQRARPGQRAAAGTRDSSRSGTRRATIRGASSRGARVAGRARRSRAADGQARTRPERTRRASGTTAAWSSARRAACSASRAAAGASAGRPGSTRRSAAPGRVVAARPAGTAGRTPISASSPDRRAAWPRSSRQRLARTRRRPATCRAARSLMRRPATRRA